MSINYKYFKKLPRIAAFAILILTSIDLVSQSTLKLTTANSKTYNDYSAYFLARSTLKEAIEEAKKQNKYDPIAIGEAYRELSLSNYHIGFSLEYADNVDSMYHYKKRSGERIYFVEYAAYKLRSYALDHNYAPAFDLMKRAKAALDSNRHKADLIDTLFFRANELNIQRNFRLEGETQEEFFNRKWELFKQYEAIDWSIQKDPTKRATYYRFLGNFMQDFVIYNERYYDRARSDSAKEKSIAYYKKGIEEIRNHLGFDNEMVLRFQMLIALQYGKNEPEQEKCLKLFSEISDHMNVSINNHSYYRSISLPLSVNKIYASYIIKFGVDSLITNTKNALENSQRMRRLFVSQQTKFKEDWLNEGYSLNTNDELIALLIYQLGDQENYQDSLKIISKIWNLQSVRYQPTNYLEAVRRAVGTSYFSEMNSQLDSLELHRLSLIDQYYIVTLGKGEARNTNRLENEIKMFDSSYYSLIESMNPILKKYQIGMAQQSLPEIMEDLEDDQACLIQINNPLIVNHSKNNFYHLIISNNKAEILANNNYAVYLYWKLLKSKNFDNSLWKKRSYAGYFSFFQSAHSKLSRFKRLNIQTSPQSADLSYGYFVSDTTFENNKKAPFLIKEFAFSYTQNLSVDYLNSKINNTSNKNYVFKSNCDLNDQKSDIPFTYQLVNEFKNDFGFQSLNSKQSLLKQDNSFKHLYFFSHGYSDTSLFIDYYKYKSQDKVDESYILGCGERISISEIDSTNVRGELVILSNCHSGEGYIDPHASKIDLSKVFIKNGSHTVISSLSEIDDQSTSLILEDFIYYLSEGEYPSIALQRAKLRFLENIKDPSQYSPVYWAGLTVSGLDEPIEISKEKYWLYLVIVGSLLVMIFLVIKLRR